MELRLPQHLGVVAIEKGAFGSPLTKVDNLLLLVYLLSNVKSEMPTTVWLASNFQSDNDKITYLCQKFKRSRLLPA